MIAPRVATAGLTALIALGACGKIDTAPPNAIAQSATTQSNHELGREIYNFRCYYCHGYSGDAQTLAATFLNPPPRNFRDSPPSELPRQRMIEAITRGRAGTAMKSFVGALSANEISAVADFVLEEFTRRKEHNTYYHTAANGWRDHERYRSAFPFATGQIPLDAAIDNLSADQRQGKHLFMNACISCHDRAKVNDEGAAWAIRPVTYPPDFYLLAESGRVKDGEGFDPHQPHEKAPTLRGLSKIEKRGEQLYQKNCAFCHAADGTGRNWIGSFIEPNATDLTLPRNGGREKSWLVVVITEGVDGTSMPAWKHVLAETDIQAVAAYVTRAFAAPNDTSSRRKG